jgi:hypothetical protein
MDNKKGPQPLLRAETLAVHVQSIKCSHLRCILHSLCKLLLVRVDVVHGNPVQSLAMVTVPASQ